MRAFYWSLQPTTDMRCQPRILVKLLNTSFTMLLYRVCLCRFFCQAAVQSAEGSSSRLAIVFSWIPLCFSGSGERNGDTM